MTDTCPSCLRRGICPAKTRTRGDTTIHAYRCPGCGHCWTTARLAAVYPAQPDRRSAA